MNKDRRLDSLLGRNTKKFLPIFWEVVVEDVVFKGRSMNITNCQMFTILERRDAFKIIIKICITQLYHMPKYITVQQPQ